MPYKVDVWGGAAHQIHLGARAFASWAAASDFMGPLLDEGLLCKVQNPDAIASEIVVDEVAQELANLLPRRVRP